MDLFADPADRDEVSPFIRMLCGKGASHEQSIVGQIGVPPVPSHAFRRSLHDVVQNPFAQTRMMEDQLDEMLNIARASVSEFR